MARVVLFFLVALMVAQETDLHAPLAWMVFGFALFESLCVRWNYSALYPSSMEQFGGWLQNPLHSGLLVPAGLIFAITKLGESRKALVQAGFIFSILFFSYTLYLLRSRAGILAVLCIAPFLLSEKWRWRILSVAALTAIIGAFAAREQLMKYMEIDPYGVLSTMGRFSIWKTDLLAIADRPFIGHGMGNFGAAYAMFQQPSAELLRYGKSTIFAHNGFLQTAVESGVPAALFLVGGFFILLKGTGKIPPKTGYERWAWYVLLAFFITGMFNYSLFLPSNGMIFSACAGILISKQSGVKVDLRHHKSSIGLILIIFSFFSVCFGIAAHHAKRGDMARAIKFMPMSAGYWYEYAMQGLNDAVFRTSPEGPAAIVARLNKSLLMNPGDPFVWSRLARVLSALSAEQNNPDVEMAFQRANELAPKHAPFWIERGMYNLSINKLDGALLNFKEAIKLEPQAPLPYFGAGLCSLKLGDFHGAIEYLGRSKEMKLRQPTVEAESPYNKEIINTPYGNFLFSVDIGQIDDLLLKANKKSQ